MPNNSQKAGDNSAQIQTENLIIGINEKRAREIFNEEYALQAKELTQEAQIAAAERVGILEGKIIEKFEQYKELLDFFKKPEFLFLIQLAQKTAIQTERNEDYELLANLLFNKIQKNDDKKFGTGIKQAIQIVGEIDLDSINALTALFIHQTYVPFSLSVEKYFEILNNMFNTCIRFPLPLGTSWYDQLDVLKCIRIDNMKRYIKFIDYQIFRNSHLFAAGILKDSDNYKKAIKLLENNNLPSNFLVESELIENYVKLNILSEESIDEETLLTINDKLNVEEVIKLKDEQKKALKSIISLYDQSNEIKDKIKNSIDKIVMKYSTLNSFRYWLDDLEFYAELTCVGKSLAYTNSKMKDDSLPNIYE